MAGNRLRRSRTPPAMRRPRTLASACCLCLDEMQQADDVWSCLQCNVVAHVSCMPTNRHGRIHLPNGCPQCRVTMTQLLRIADTPLPATKGLLCFACRYVIDEGTLCRRCPAPRHYCQAHWHADAACRAGRCPGCGKNSFEALCMRRQ
jgi:hypothetical protein